MEMWKDFLTLYEGSFITGSILKRYRFALGWIYANYRCLYIYMKPYKGWWGFHLSVCQSGNCDIYGQGFGEEAKGT